MSALYSLIVVTGIVILLDFLYRKVYGPMKYWKKRNVPTVTSIPIFGSFWKSLCRIEHFSESLQNAYFENADKKLFGGFTFGNPILFVRDAKLIHDITIKHFDHFVDHSTMFFSEDLDPLFANSLMLLKGQDWHNVRGILSPAFTGSKIRGMFNLIVECGKQLSDHLSEEFKQGHDTLEIEIKSKLNKFSNDIIASTAFGIKIDSFKNPENQFYLNGQHATNLSLSKMLIMLVAPWILKLTKEGVIPKKASNYFVNVIKTTMAQRENLGIKRPDMLNLMTEAMKSLSERKKNGENVRELTELDIVANSFLFFFAGFETTATAISFTCYELAINPDVQKKLHAEIDSVLNDSNQSVTYEQLNDMKYLEAVISESLRKWSGGGGGGTLDRICIKDFLIEDAFGKGKDFLFKKGDILQLLVGAVQNDPEYYPEPEKFIPERFIDEYGKFKVDQSIWYPFGSGPRQCIGNRFAMVEIKTAIFSVLKDYELVPTTKTHVPIRLDKSATTIVPENGFNVGLKRRTK